MGCTWRLRRDESASLLGEAAAPTLDYDLGGAGPNRGSLCAKGNMSLELMTHPRRLESPLLREDERARPVGWEEALRFVVARLDRIRAAHGGGSIGMLLGPQLTLEETAAALRLARALGTTHVDLCEPGDHAVLSGIAYSAARPARVESVEQLDTMDALLVVGDLLTLAPCAAKPVLDARYRSRRNTVAVLAPNRTRTVWFGRPALPCVATGEAPALALMLALALEAAGPGGPAWADAARAHLARFTHGELERRSGLAQASAAAVGRALAAGPSAGVLLAGQLGATARLDLVSGLAALLAEAVGARFLAMLEGANSHGIRAELARAGYAGGAGYTTPELLEATVTGDIQALLVFGADPVAAFPGLVAGQAARTAALLAVTAPLPGLTARAAHVVLPSAVFGEKSGSVTGAFGGRSRLATVLAPPGRARPDLAILEALDAAMSAVAPAAPLAAAPARERSDAVDGFCRELDLFLAAETREAGACEPGTHLLLAEASATNAAEGALTGQLSWARYAHPEPLLRLSTAHAGALGVRAGDRVRVRSNWGQAELRVRLDASLPEGIVTVPHRDPAVRGLLRWRRESTVRCLDLRPDRVSLERVTEVERA